MKRFLRGSVLAMGILSSGHAAADYIVCSDNKCWELDDLRKFLIPAHHCVLVWQEISNVYWTEIHCNNGSEPRPIDDDGTDRTSLRLPSGIERLPSIPADPKAVSLPQSSLPEQFRNPDSASLSAGIEERERSVPMKQMVTPASARKKD